MDHNKCVIDYLARPELPNFEAIRLTFLVVTVDDEFVEYYNMLLEECVGVSKQKYMTSLGCSSVQLQCCRKVGDA